MTTFSPIVLPHPTDPSWKRAEQLVTAFRARGEQNPFIVAAIANGYAESAWRAVIAGDNDKSFGPWQINWVYGGLPIVKATGIDIRTEPDLAKHVDALLWLLASKPYARISADIDAAKTGADATRAFVVDFERAGAAGAVERRVAIAPQIEVWLAGLKV